MIDEKNQWNCQQLLDKLDNVILKEIGKFLIKGIVDMAIDYQVPERYRWPEFRFYKSFSSLRHTWSTNNLRALDVIGIYWFENLNALKPCRITSFLTLFPLPTSCLLDQTIRLTWLTPNFQALQNLHSKVQYCFRKTTLSTCWRSNLFYILCYPRGRL